MQERAVRQRWPISEQLRQALLERMQRIALDEQTSPREATSAFKAVVSADKQNQDEEKGDHVSLGKYYDDIAAITEMLLELMTDEQRAAARRKIEDYIREAQTPTI